MKRIEYILFRVFQTFIRVIPFRWMYALSDVFSFAAQYIVRYRKNTVYRNLKQSFPEKSEEEISKITRGFYRNLCDVALESYKGYSLSIDQLKLRYDCLNPEVANNYFEEWQNVIFAISHYANWMWGTRVATISWYDVVIFYNPLSNKYIERYILEQGELKGIEAYSIYDTRYIFQPFGNMPRSYILNCDQNPNRFRQAYRMKFLNQETECINEIESQALLLNLPVIFADVQRIKRGYYTVVLEVICDNPKDTKPGEITERYMKKLEKIIIRKPEDWLWSYRRW